MLEAASQAQAFSTPVLLVAYDIANAAPFCDIEPVADSLGVALVITNGAANGGSSDAPLGQLCEIAFEAVLAPETDSQNNRENNRENDREAEQTAEQKAREIFSEPKSEALRSFARLNPVGDALTVIEQFVAPRDNCSLTLAAAPAAALRLSYA